MRVRRKLEIQWAAIFGWKGDRFVDPLVTERATQPVFQCLRKLLVLEDIDKIKHTKPCFRFHEQWLVMNGLDELIPMNERMRP